MPEEAVLTEATTRWETHHPAIEAYLDAESQRLTEHSTDLDPKSFTSIWGSPLTNRDFSKLKFKDKAKYLAWVARNVGIE